MLFWCANLSRQNNAEILPNIKTPIRSIQINLASAYVIHTNRIMTSQGTLTCARHQTDINSLHWYFPKVLICSDSVQFVFLVWSTCIHSQIRTRLNWHFILLTYNTGVVTWTAEWIDIYWQYICEKVLIVNWVFFYHS